MKTKAFLLISALSVFAPLIAQEAITQSVVKIFTTYSDYNYDDPWNMKGQYSATGSGCIIAGNKVLTNAHVVSNSTFIQVMKAGGATKFIAHVEAISHASDLAILKVDDPLFFEGSIPIPVGELPKSRDKVVVYGFPTGGDEMSVTEGVVSRIEQTKYSHSGYYFLACQIDAAINYGNSGGPVILDDKIVGVVFQGNSYAQNIGYMVPAPVITHFLDDLKDGRYDGFPDLGVRYQSMENSDLRAKYKMKVDQTGVLVAGIFYDSPASNFLKIGDVILSVDKSKVQNNGTIEFRKGERTSFEYLVQQKQLNDFTTVVVLRNGEEKTIKIKLSDTFGATLLVSEASYDKKPTYYIAGGLVFQPLTMNYLYTWGDEWYNDAPSQFLEYYYNGEKSEHKKQIVILTKVLADEINQGYQDFWNETIVKVNGRLISSIKDVVLAMETNTAEFHIIEDYLGRIIIMRRDTVEKNSNRILQTYQITSDRSDDLKK